jgi:hypothetical protein
MNQQKLGTVAAIVGILVGTLSIVAALTQSNPTLSWIALVVAIIALVWYFVQGLRMALIIIALGALAVIAIVVALWLGPVTVEVTAYVDQNGNGIREGGESTVGAGMEVKLLDRNGVTRVAVTDDRGTAIFLDVPQGPYGIQLGGPGISGRAERLRPNAIVAISPTPAPSLTPSPTYTATPTSTFTPSPNPTDTPTSTFTPSPNPTVTPAVTVTPTETPTSTLTPSATFILSPTPFVYVRECELPDSSTVGMQITRSNASGQSVHGQFGTLDSDPFPPRPGCVMYTGINLPQVEHLYIQIRYSKDSSSHIPIHIYMDDESVPRKTFYPENLEDWNAFALTLKYDLGPVGSGTHSIKLCTDGQQYGVAELDRFTLTAK